jgi:hypothetical protein
MYIGDLYVRDYADDVVRLLKSYISLSIPLGDAIILASSALMAHDGVPQDVL